MQPQRSCAPELTVHPRANRDGVSRHPRQMRALAQGSRSNNALPAPRRPICRLPCMAVPCALFSYTILTPSKTRVVYSADGHNRPHHRSRPQGPQRHRPRRARPGHRPRRLRRLEHRPEVESALEIAHWLHQRRSRIDAHRFIESAIKHLHAALDQRPPVTSLTHLAETRRAATALADLALSLLYGPPRSRVPRSKSGTGDDDRGLRAPCPPLGGAVSERRSGTEGAPSSTPSTEPPTRDKPATADALPTTRANAPSRTQHTPRIHNAHTRAASPDAPLPISESPYLPVTLVSSPLDVPSTPRHPTSRPSLLATRAGTTDTS